MRLIKIRDGDNSGVWINPDNISEIEVSYDYLRVVMSSGNYYDIEDNIYSFLRRMRHEETIES